MITGSSKAVPDKCILHEYPINVFGSILKVCIHPGQCYRVKIKQISQNQCKRKIYNHIHNVNCLVN